MPPPRHLSDPVLKVIAGLYDVLKSGNTFKPEQLDDFEKEELRRREIKRLREVDNV
jgi:hypothetical protein